MENNRITIFNCLKILILLTITALVFIFICVVIAEIFKLNTLDFLSPDIGEIISVICVLIYLYKKFDITLNSLLNLKEFNLKTLILILLMFFSSYIVINLITANITKVASIIQPIPEHNDGLSQISNLTLLFFFARLIIIGPIIEEIFFRGIFLLKLKDNCIIIVALTLSTLLFAIFHSSGYGQISALITGLLFGIVTLKTNGIFYSIIGHILFNSLTTIFGVISNANNNIVKLANGSFHFNNVINIISIAIFIATFFIIFKVPLNKVNI